MQNKKSSFLFKTFPFLLPVSLVLILLIQIIFFINFINSDNGYIETSFFAFVLSLCNSIPFFYRVYKKKNTESFASWTLFCNFITGIFSMIKYPASFYYAMQSNQTNISTELLRWIPDVLANVISFATAIYVLIIKIKNSKINPSENIKIKFYNTRIVIIAIVICCLATIALAVTLYFKIHNAKNQSHIWLYVVMVISSCISSIAAVPFIIKLIFTKHTYSISLYSKVSLFLAMIVWTILDVLTFNNGLYVFLPLLISDAFVFIWATIPIIYKIINLINAKKQGISEKEYCENIKKTVL